VTLPIDTIVDRVATGEGLERGPRIVIALACDNLSRAETYLRFRDAPPQCHAGRAVLIMTRTDVLNSPDEIRLTCSERSGQTFRITFETRRFVGPLFANVLSVGLITLNAGSLDPGTYEAVVEETTFKFDDLSRPGRASNGVASLERQVFECLPN
jgi:hypothetical protein